MPTLTEIPPPDRAAIDDALARYGDAVVEFVRAHSDVDRPVPGLTWTARQLIGHLAFSIGTFGGELERKGSPWSLTTPGHVTRVNGETWHLAWEDGRPIAEVLAQRYADLRAALASVDLATPVPWNDGVPMLPARIASLAVGETMAHGWELARAFKEPFGFRPADVDLVMRGAFAPAAPYFITDAGRRATATFGVRLRGQGTYTFVFADGGLRVGQGWDGPVDCKVGADPTTYVLAATGRLGRVAPALTGRMVAYGRKPWLALRLPDLIKVP